MTSTSSKGLATMTGERPQDSKRDVTIVFYSGLADLVDDLGWPLATDEAMPDDVIAGIQHIISQLLKWPNPVVVVGRHGDGMGRGSDMYTWLGRIQSMLVSQAKGCWNGEPKWHPQQRRTQ